MRSLKQYLVIVILFIMLAAIVFLPIPLLNSQNDLLLASLHIYTENAVIPEDGVVSDSYSILDKINILSEDNIVIHSSSYNDLQILNELKDQLLPILKDHILYLQEHSALPRFVISDSLYTDIIQKTYMSVDEPSLSLSVWEIYAEYEFFTVTAYIDPSSYALYDITLSSQLNYFSVYKQDLSGNCFVTYFAEHSGLSKADIYCEGIYSPTIISLYLAENGKEYHFSRKSIHNEHLSEIIMQK